jgi:hypothetical protein
MDPILTASSISRVFRELRFISIFIEKPRGLSRRSSHDEDGRVSDVT